MDYLTCAFLEIKASGDEGFVTGYGSTFDNVDSYGDSVARGAFAKSSRGHKIRRLTLAADAVTAQRHG